jgi:hypothetical protein
MAQDKMTIERLAEMINEGLKTTASKEDIKEARSEVVNLRTEIRAEFDRIENLLMKQQKHEIENLEARMKKLADALAIEPSCKSGQALRRLLVARVRHQSQGDRPATASLSSAAQEASSSGAPQTRILLKAQKSRNACTLPDTSPCAAAGGGSNITHAYPQRANRVSTKTDGEFPAIHAHYISDV